MQNPAAQAAGFLFYFVVPGRCEASNPERRDSGFGPEPVIGPRFARTRWDRPEMTFAFADVS